ncbi:Neural-cadherin-like 19, partial [Homarus americanus]
CVCPGNSWGPQCKILSRSFTGQGWVWLDPLPPCHPTIVSLRILTTHPEAILLYSGPLTTSKEPLGPPATPLLVLQLMEGRPELILQGSLGVLKLRVHVTVDDGLWHSVHVRLDEEGVGVMVDLCGGGWRPDDPDDSHCVAWEAWPRPVGPEAWSGGWPLQVGGVAYTPTRPESAPTWSTTPPPRPLHGCISHLTING